MAKRFEDLWNEMTGGQHHALHMKLWSSLGQTPEERERNFQKFMAGEIQLIREETIRPLFDYLGRRIPPKGMKAPVVDADRKFYLDQKVMKLEDYGRRLALAAGYLGRSIGINPEPFMDRVNVIRGMIHGDKLLANLLHGVHLPFALPQMDIGNYGTAAEEFLPAVGKAYRNHFAGRRFSSALQGKLAEQMVPLECSWITVLLAKMVFGPVVGLYFPVSLQGYSPLACIEQLSPEFLDRAQSSLEMPPPFFPGGVQLAGVLETAMALIMYPDVLARDGQTPRLLCPAVTWQGYLPCFRAYDDELVFDAGVGNEGGGYSGGLVVLG